MDRAPDWSGRRKKKWWNWRRNGVSCLSIAASSASYVHSTEVVIHLFSSIRIQMKTTSAAKSEEKSRNECQSTSVVRRAIRRRHRNSVRNRFQRFFHFIWLVASVCFSWYRPIGHVLLCRWLSLAVLLLMKKTKKKKRALRTWRLKFVRSCFALWSLALSTRKKTTR